MPKAVISKKKLQNREVWSIHKKKRKQQKLLVWVPNSGFNGQRHQRNHHKYVQISKRNYIYRNKRMYNDNVSSIENINKQIHTIKKPKGNFGVKKYNNQNENFTRGTQQ